MLAMRGFRDDFPLALSLCQEDERQFLANGLYPIEVSQAKVLPFFRFTIIASNSRGLELFVPLVVHEEPVGAVFLGQKATGEPYTSYDREIICAMARHIALRYPAAQHDGRTRTSCLRRTASSTKTCG
jgi:hypothetical protein